MTQKHIMDEFQPHLHLHSEGLKSCELIPPIPTSGVVCDGDAATPHSISGVSATQNGGCVGETPSRRHRTTASPRRHCTPFLVNNLPWRGIRSMAHTISSTNACPNWTIAGSCS